MTIREQKKQLREQMKEVLRSISPEEKARQSTLTCQHIRTFFEHTIPQGSVIGVFAPLSSEINIVPCIEWVMEEYTVAFPKTDKQQPIMTFYTSSLDALQEGDWGVQEPTSGRMAVDGADIKVILVPGLAFDLQGRRLGRSKGMYDTFLATLPSDTMKIGVGFTQQIVEHVPVEQHDIEMDVICTAQGCFPKKFSTA